MMVEAVALSAKHSGTLAEALIYPDRSCLGIRRVYPPTYPSSQRVCNKHLTLLSVSEVPQCCNEGVICASSSPMPTDKPMDHATPTGRGWVAPLKRHARATTTLRRAGGQALARNRGGHRGSSRRAANRAPAQQAGAPARHTSSSQHPRGQVNYTPDRLQRVHKGRRAVPARPGGRSMLQSSKILEI
eukprot:scaffold103202_cov68-Phaeocystis_antarctica.AAC.2